MSMSLLSSVGSSLSALTSLRSPETVQQGSGETSISNSAASVEPAASQQDPAVTTQSSDENSGGGVTYTATGSNVGSTEQRISYSAQMKSYVYQTINPSDGLVMSQLPSESVLRMRELMQSWSGPVANATTGAVDTSA